MNFSTRKKEQNSKYTKEILKKVFSILGRVLACVIAVVLILAVTLVAAIYEISKGKSEVVREMFVTAMVETGALDFCAHMFLSDDEVNEIIEKNRIIVPEGTTDETLVVIGGGDSDPEKQDENEKKDREQGIVYDKDGICLIDIKGKTFVGKMLVVKDPSRVKVTGLPKYGDGIVGKSTEQMARETDALAAINAGGYQEMSDYRTGGIPQGIDGPGVVIIDGEMRWGNLDYTYDFIGFDNSNILRVDTMTARKALELGMRDAVNFGPVLVKNNEPCIVPSKSTNLGFHPRTAIGQRADGSVLLLIIDGRQSHSMGASYEDLIEIFMRYGAVNAANLDGGMSSYMYYKGEVITQPYMLFFNGRRTVATSIIVTKTDKSY